VTSDAYRIPVPRDEVPVAAPGPGERIVAGDSRRAAEREESRLLLLRLAAADDAERERIRSRLVEIHRPLAEHLARRFANRGEPLDDLIQVACIGLIKSIDRYDPERGVEFGTYATPTILGEVKRHFRDSTWTVHVPRRVQEVRVGLARATEALTHELGRAPTVRELAVALDASPDEVVEALESASAYSPASLDAPDPSDDGEGLSIGETLGAWDEGIGDVEYRETLRPLLAALPERERTILVLRFFRNQTQSQIAAQIGVSQMHVSRLLARTLSTLREGMLAD
jgi:RNA polymerase sigma-B factor